MDDFSLMYQDTDRKTIDLSKGTPASNLLPIDALQEACEMVLRNPTNYVPALAYGFPIGDSSVREAVAQWLATQYHSSWTSADRICITGGASQHLACILDACTDPVYTDAIHLVAPTYSYASRIFEDAGFTGRLRAIPEDDQGMNIDALASSLATRSTVLSPRTKQIKTPLSHQRYYRSVIYCVPTCANPSGRVMSFQRRRDLVRLARRYDALIISDDVYDFLTWSEDPLLPRLVDIDHKLDGGPITPFGNTVSNGSFSKIVGPGMRAGWTESTPEFACGMAQVGTSVAGGSGSQFTSYLLREMLKSGSLQDHLTDVLVPALEQHATAALWAVQTLLVPLGVTLPAMRRSGSCIPIQGGYYIYCILPRPILASELVEKAEKEQHVIVAGGRDFEVLGDEVAVSCRHGMRICFAWENEERIIEGIRRLSKTLSELLSFSPEVWTLDLE